LLDGDAFTKQTLLDPTAVRRVWREHLDGRANHGHALWVVLMLQAWRDQWRC
jgi:asparagine synthase (glutamine-hydrolysing)